MMFCSQHIGPNKEQQSHMLQTISSETHIENLIARIVPKEIQLKSPIALPCPFDEKEYLRELCEQSQQHDQGVCFIGRGFYGTHIPKVIERNILLNPGWYTAYTPYQPEISQGRLEALLNFQTMICDITHMEIANASLLDEGSAVCEAMLMAYRSRNSEGKQFVIAKGVWKSTLEVVKGRALGLDIDVAIQDIDDEHFGHNAFGVLIQYPFAKGELRDLEITIKKLKENGIFVVIASDLLALCLLKPPGEWGVDVVVGSSQRFGTPMGFGGPHAAFFATREEHKRLMPGRVVGVSKDKYGLPGLRLALQTREQHIRREKATSNICTAQALLAILAGFYAVHHGASGLKEIAFNIHQKALWLEARLVDLGLIQENKFFFDTLCFKFSSVEECSSFYEACEQEGIYVYKRSNDSLTLSVDETHTYEDLQKVVMVYEVLLEKKVTSFEAPSYLLSKIPQALYRHEPILKARVFEIYTSETNLMRYIKYLENKDLSLTRAMIPLGSCTMKLNAAVELEALTTKAFAQLHPMLPIKPSKGMINILRELESYLCALTQLDGVCLQPNSGAQGEYAGLMVIKAYLKHIGQASRTMALIPSSAHGTNPASAALAGLEVCVLKCTADGKIDRDDFLDKISLYHDRIAVMMMTYPSTYGIFEEGITFYTQKIHEIGAQVYLDGANLNAMVGLSSPKLVGADVCHMNLHKTFCIPHGGGGPGMGPIAVASHLIPYLPGQQCGIKPVASSSYGSALIGLISHAYIRLMGFEGLRSSSQVAILNANYMKKRLVSHYDILFSDSSGYVAHEFILDLRPFKISAGLEVDDIAKRLMDYGFHAPTVSWPVPGTIMVEPTESESQEELDRFCDAMIAIREEIAAIEKGVISRESNPLKMAPHTMKDLENWGDRGYSIEKGCFPSSFTKRDKYWPRVNRVDHVYGDRHLVCSCHS